MVGLGPTIQPSACSGAFGTMDPRAKPEDDTRGAPKLSSGPRRSGAPGSRGPICTPANGERVQRVNETRARTQREWCSLATPHSQEKHLSCLEVDDLATYKVYRCMAKTNVHALPRTPPRTWERLIRQ